MKQTYITSVSSDNLSHEHICGQIISPLLMQKWGEALHFSLADLTTYTKQTGNSQSVFSLFVEILSHILCSLQEEGNGACQVVASTNKELWAGFLMAQSTYQVINKSTMCCQICQKHSIKHFGFLVGQNNLYVCSALSLIILQPVNVQHYYSCCQLPKT